MNNYSKEEFDAVLENLDKTINEYSDYIGENQTSKNNLKRIEKISDNFGVLGRKFFSPNNRRKDYTDITESTVIKMESLISTLNNEMEFFNSRTEEISEKCNLCELFIRAHKK